MDGAFPEQTDVDDGVAVAVGIGFTVTVTVAVLPVQPFEVGVTVYVTVPGVTPLAVNV